MTNVFRSIGSNQKAKQISQNFEALLTRCRQMRAESFLLSGLTEEELSRAGNEARLMYEHWCSEYKGPDLPNQYIGFCKMLEDWPVPWQAYEESAVNGLTLVQYFLSYAFDAAEQAILLLKERAYDLDSVDLAATQAIWAAMFLTKAKELAVTSGKVLVQKKLKISENSPSS